MIDVVVAELLPGVGSTVVADTEAVFAELPSTPGAMVPTIVTTVDEPFGNGVAPRTGDAHRPTSCT